MPHRQFTDLLKRWECDYQRQSQLITEEISIEKDDAIKLCALAEVYGLPKAVIATSLMHQALKTLEEQMPYIAGPRVIRVEEGNEIYEDVGPMPRYLAAKASMQSANTDNEKV
jgi:hypothetical protein